MKKGTVVSYRVFKQAKSINGGRGDNLILDLSRLDVITCRKYLMGDYRISSKKINYHRLVCMVFRQRIRKFQSYK